MTQKPEKKYMVVGYATAGYVGIAYEVSRHATTAAAWRKVHALERQTGKKGDFGVMNAETLETLLEVKTRRNGRWGTV